MTVGFASLPRAADARGAVPSVSFRPARRSSGEKVEEVRSNSSGGARVAAEGRGEKDGCKNGQEVEKKGEDQRGRNMRGGAALQGVTRRIHLNPKHSFLERAARTMTRGAPGARQWGESGAPPP